MLQFFSFFAVTGVADLRILVFGRSGYSQFSLTNSILQTNVFDVKVCSAHSKKHRGKVFERTLAIVNTPNLSEYDSSQIHLKKEFKRAVCMSSPGPHAILFAVDLHNISPSVISILQVITKHFGDILSHMIVVVCHDGEMEGSTLKERVKNNRDLKELIEKCDQRYYFFNERKALRNEGVSRELLEKIDMVMGNNGRFYSNHEYQDAEERIQKQEQFMLKKREKEMLKKRNELESTFTGEDLERELVQYERGIFFENRERAESNIAETLGLTLRLVDYAAAIGKGAVVGGLCGAVMGLEGMLVGAVFGAIVGISVGGAARAAWGYVSNAT